MGIRRVPAAHTEALLDKVEPPGHLAHEAWVPGHRPQPPHHPHLPPPPQYCHQRTQMRDAVSTE